MKHLFLLFSVVLVIFGCSTNNNGTVTVVPLAPTNLTGSTISTTQINLSWTDNATNEVGYKIERKTGAGSYAIIGSTATNLTTFNDLGLTPNTSYTYRVYAYNSAGNSVQYSNEITIATQDLTPSWLTNGLIGYWPFNGNANDESGNGNNGTVNSATLTSDRFGNVNSAYGLSTLSDNLTVNGVQPSFNNLVITVSLWVKFPSQWNQSSLALLKNGTPYTNGFNLAIDQNNSAYGVNNYSVIFLVGNYNAVTFIANQSELGLWSNIVGTYDGSNLKIYLNGILKATQAYNQSMNIQNNNLIFGSWDNPTTPLVRSRQLDDIRI
jgi:hypothetical protein